jgi:hypothetical protein
MADQITTVARRDVSATIVRELPDHAGLKCLVAHAKQLVDVPPEARTADGSKYVFLSEPFHFLKILKNLTQVESF